MSESSAPAAAAPSAPAAAPAAVEAPAIAALEAKAPAAPTDAKADPKAPAKDDKPAEAPRKFKVKVDGQELEVSEEDLLRGYQTREAADKRFKEGAQARREAEAYRAEVNSVLELMQKDPRGFAEKAKGLGINPAEFAEAILRPIVEEEIAAEEEKQMSPEQLKQREMERKLKAYEAKDAEAAKQAAEAEKAKATQATQAATDARTQEYSNIILEALKASNLPHTHETGLEMVDLLQETIERGIPLDAKALARDLESRKRAELRAVATPDMLDPAMRAAIRREAMNDPALVEEIRKQAVKEFKEANAMAAKNPQVKKSSVPTRDESKKPQTYGSVMRELQRDAAKGTRR